MELGAPGLETSLIRLEPLSEAHRERIRQRNPTEDMWKSMAMISAGTTFDAYFDHTLRMAELGTGQGVVAVRNEGGDVFGMAAYLSASRQHRRTRIGYTWIDNPYRGSGLIDHIHFLMLKRAIEWRAKRVEWMLSVRNDRAISNIERLGGQREGVLRQYARFADGTWADLLVLSLIGEEIRIAARGIGDRIGETMPSPALDLSR